MFPIVMAVLGLLATADAARAQQCLHAQLETSEDRIRRERAIDVARRVHAAQHAPAPFRAPGTPRYRPLEELPALSPVPEGFDLQFLTDGRGYIVSLKDRRDPCRFTVFSDQDGAIYAAMPQPPRAVVVPLETR